MRGDGLVITQVYRPSLIFIWMENIFDAGQPGNIEKVGPHEVSACNIRWVYVNSNE